MRGRMSKAKALTLVGLLAAVEVVLTLTPLGFIPLGVTKARRSISRLSWEPCCWGRPRERCSAACLAF